MSRLTRDGTAEPVSRDQIFRHARGQGNVHFPCSADHEQDWQPYPVDPYSAICDDHTYIHTYNPACGHKEVRRSTGHIMVTTRYSDQQGSKSRQKVMRLYKQWHRPISKRFIKPAYSISRATSIDSECCRPPTTNVLSKKPE